MVVSMLMMILNFILGIVLAIIALYVEHEKMPWREALLAKWSSFPMCVRSFILVTLACSSSVIGLINGCEAQREHDADEAQIKQLQDSADKSETALEDTREKLIAATRKIEIQTREISEQRKTIGSIAYNTPTTFDGKLRFIRCFKDLSRLTDMKTEGTCFEGLICDDGVAMYWFDVEKDLLTGFHFFPNDELNRVLSGIPFDEKLLDASGRLSIAADSELAIALNESLSRRTPSFSTATPTKERSDEVIVAELKTLFRYVYRAQYSEFKEAYFKHTRKTDGTRYLMFQYLVNPFATQPHLRTVSNIKLSAPFMRSLHGASMIEFSQRVILECRRLGIEPKIRRADVRHLNSIHVRDELMTNSPFRQLHKKGD